MRFFFSFILILSGIFLCPIQAQENSIVEKDSVSPGVDIPNSGVLVQKSIIADSEFKPNPKKAVIYSAIFPGLGQIYNRKYWKLPIVYGGFLGCAYAITWNSTQYDGYKQAYNDITDNDPNTNSWQNYLRYGMNPSDLSPSDMDWYTNAFKNKKDFFRRNRDLSYIVTVGMYALCMLDAYVDAQLFDFDINPELSMKVEPVFFEKSAFNSRSVGLQCSIKF